MIKEIYIDNFKSLNDFKIELTPITVLIGENSAGKSTVLQAFDLLSNFFDYDVNNYFENKIWASSGLKSKLSSKHNIVFKIKVFIQSLENDVDWEVVLKPNSQRKYFDVVSETITRNNKVFTYLKRDNNGLIIRSEKTKEEIRSEIPFKSKNTAITSIFDTKHKDKFPELIELKRAVNKISFIGSFSPEKMRIFNSDSISEDIGKEGENLASYLFYLDKSKKIKLSPLLKKYIKCVDDIKPRKRKNKDITFDIIENFDTKNIRINSKYLSDGYLRIIALLAVIQLNIPDTLVMIDEIENGIYPHLAGEIVEEIEKKCHENSIQLIITTHSHTFANYVNEKNIIYMHKDNKGIVHSTRIFAENKKMQELLDFMNPGDAWINTDKNELFK